jgi:hypothetical protein
MEKSLRLVVFLICILVISLNCEAKKVSGFIITNTSDTLIGEVKVYLRNPNMRGFNIYGIDVEPFYSVVRFKGNTDKWFKNYEPKDILGFCFRYKSNDYFFHEFKLIKKSLFSTDCFQYRFLNLIYKGSISLYQDVIRFPLMKNFDNFVQYSETYYDYYLYDSIKGIQKVEFTKDIKTVKDILSFYNVDEDFLNKIPENSRPKEIKDILEKYDSWLIEHPLRIPNKIN